MGRDTTTNDTCDQFVSLCSCVCGNLMSPHGHCISHFACLCSHGHFVVLCGHFASIFVTSFCVSGGFMPLCNHFMCPCVLFVSLLSFSVSL